MNIDVDKLYGEFSYKLNNSNKRKKNKKLIIEELVIDLNQKLLIMKLTQVVEIVKLEEY